MRFGDSPEADARRAIAESACAMLFGPIEGIKDCAAGWSPVSDMDRIVVADIIDGKDTDSGVYRAWARAVLRAGEWKGRWFLGDNQDGLARSVVPWLMPMRGVSPPNGPSAPLGHHGVQLAVVGPPEFFVELEAFAESLLDAAAAIDKLVPAKGGRAVDRVKWFLQAIVLAKALQGTGWVSEKDKVALMDLISPGGGQPPIVDDRCPRFVFGDSEFAACECTVEERFIDVGNEPGAAWIAILCIKSRDK